MNIVKRPALERELSWSYSREDVFTRCPLEYWFAYYGSHGGWDKDAPCLARELYTLKNTKNRYAWAGDLVHEAIEDFLNQWLDGRPASRDATVERVHKRMQRQFLESRDRKYRERPGKSRNGLVEHENNIPVEPEKWKALNETVRHCTANFFFTDFYKRFVATDSRQVIKIERLDHFFEDGVKVYAKPDVAVRDNGRLLIIDWKTGRENDEHEFQACFYALYAIRKLKIPAELIDSSIVYLKDNTNTRVEITDNMIKAALTHLKEIFSAMVTFDTQNKEGMQYDTIPKAKSKATCFLCRFKKVCS